MKCFILLFFLFLALCQNAFGTETATLKFTSFFLFQWIANCAQTLHQVLIEQGYPEAIAIREAAAHCSCVIDAFRINFTQEETQNLSFVDRQLFAETYSQQCMMVKL